MPNAVADHTERVAADVHRGFLFTHCQREHFRFACFTSLRACAGTALPAVLPRQQHPLRQLCMKHIVARAQTLESICPQIVRHRISDVLAGSVCQPNANLLQPCFIRRQNTIPIRIDPRTAGNRRTPDRFHVFCPDPVSFVDCKR